MYTWNQAMQMVQTLNEKGGFAGYKDWRVPNAKELTSIIDNQCIWPSSYNPQLNSHAWLVFFDSNDYNLSNWYPKHNSCYIRLVRGGR